MRFRRRGCDACAWPLPLTRPCANFHNTNNSKQERQLARHQRRHRQRRLGVDRLEQDRVPAPHRARAVVRVGEKRQRRCSRRRRPLAAAAAVNHRAPTIKRMLKDVMLITKQIGRGKGHSNGPPVAVEKTNTHACVLAARSPRRPKKLSALLLSSFNSRALLPLFFGPRLLPCLRHQYQFISSQTINLRARPRARGRAARPTWPRSARAPRRSAAPRRAAPRSWPGLFV